MIPTSSFAKNLRLYFGGSEAEQSSDKSRPDTTKVVEKVVRLSRKSPFDQNIADAFALKRSQSHQLNSSRPDTTKTVKKVAGLSRKSSFDRNIANAFALKRSQSQKLNSSGPDETKVEKFEDGLAAEKCLGKLQELKQRLASIKPKEWGLGEDEPFPRASLSFLTSPKMQKPLEELTLRELEKKQRRWQSELTFTTSLRKDLKILGDEWGSIESRERLERKRDALFKKKREYIPIILGYQQEINRLIRELSTLTGDASLKARCISIISTCQKEMERLKTEFNTDVSPDPQEDKTKEQLFRVDHDKMCLNLCKTERRLESQLEDFIEVISAKLRRSAIEKRPPSEISNEEANELISAEREERKVKRKRKRKKKKKVEKHSSDNEFALSPEVLRGKQVMELTQQHNIYGYHPRVDKLWAKKNRDKMRQISKRNVQGAVIYPYAGHTDGEIDDQRSRHYLPGIGKLISGKYKESHSFPTDRGIGLICKLTKEGVSRIGKVYLGIDAKNEIYHRYFEPLNPSDPDQDIFIDLMENGQPEIDPGLEGDGWVVNAKDYWYELDEKGVITIRYPNEDYNLRVFPIRKDLLDRRCFQL